jgi:hypothetical protein
MRGPVDLDIDHDVVPRARPSAAGRRKAEPPFE